jgi:hypothetical protein
MGEMEGIQASWAKSQGHPCQHSLSSPDTMHEPVLQCYIEIFTIRAG